MRTILLPLDGSVTDRLALETGLTVAMQFGAHLTALLTRMEMADVPVYAHFATTSGFAVLAQAVRDHADARHEDVRHRAVVHDLVLYPRQSLAKDEELFGPQLGAIHFRAVPDLYRREDVDHGR